MSLLARATMALTLALRLGLMAPASVKALNASVPDSGILNARTKISAASSRVIGGSREALPARAA